MIFPRRPIFLGDFTRGIHAGACGKTFGAREIAREFVFARRRGFGRAKCLSLGIPAFFVFSALGPACGSTTFPHHVGKSSALFRQSALPSFLNLTQ